MKKLFCLLAACLLAVPLSAADLSDYRYDDAGLTLSLPQGEEWVILTHDVQEGDPAIDFFESDLDTIKKSLDQNNIRFEAITQDRMCEITTIVSRDRNSRRTFNYALVDEEELLAEAQEYVDKDYTAESPGFDYTAYDLVTLGELRFIRFVGQIVNDTADTRFIQYVTIYNGWMVNISLLSFDGQMSAENEELSAGIAASVRFDEALDKSQDPQQYIDLAVGLGVGILAVLLFLRFQRKRKLRLMAASARANAPADPASADPASQAEQPLPPQSTDQEPPQQ